MFNSVFTPWGSPVVLIGSLVLVALMIQGSLILWGGYRVQQGNTKKLSIFLLLLSSFLVIYFAPPGIVASLFLVQSAGVLTSFIGLIYFVRVAFEQINRSVKHDALRFLSLSLILSMSLGSIAFLLMPRIDVEEPVADLADIGRVLSGASAGNLPEISSLNIKSFPDIPIHPYEFPKIFQTHLACYSNFHTPGLKSIFESLSERQFDDDYSDLLSILGEGQLADLYSHEMRAILGIALDDGIGFSDIESYSAMRDASLDVLSDAFDDGSILAGLALAEGYFSYSGSAWDNYPSLRESHEPQTVANLSKDLNDEIYNKLSYWSGGGAPYESEGIQISYSAREFIQELNAPRDPSHTWFGARSGTIELAEVLELISEKLLELELEKLDQPGPYYAYVRGLLEYSQGNAFVATALMLEADELCPEFYDAKTFIAWNMREPYLENFLQVQPPESLILAQSLAIAEYGDVINDDNFLEHIFAGRELLSAIKENHPGAAFTLAQIIEIEMTPSSWSSRPQFVSFVSDQSFSESLFEEMQFNYRLAAGQGHPDAVYQLARYAVSEFVVDDYGFVDYSKGEWPFETVYLAAALGSSEAQGRLKFQINEGYGNKEDLFALASTAYERERHIGDFQLAEFSLKELVTESIVSLSEDKLNYTYEAVTDYIEAAQLSEVYDELDSGATWDDVGWKLTALFDAENSLRLIDSLRLSLFGEGTNRDELLSSAKDTKNYALLIGNANYPNLPDLKTPLNDVEALKSILEDSFGFEVTVLRNADRQETLESINQFRSRLTRSDNFLLYYAGHGTLDSEVDEGYWQPVDADVDDDTNWIPTTRIETTLRGFNSNNVLVIADSCFSGVLTRGITLADAERGEEFSSGLLEDFLNNKTRVAISSGNLEPVLDSVPGQDNSAFALALLESLQNLGSAKAASDVFSTIRDNLEANLTGTGFTQTPQYSVLRRANHERGDFIFFPRAEM